jgi:hypothetical protein
MGVEERLDLDERLLATDEARERGWQVVWSGDLIMQQTGHIGPQLLGHRLAPGSSGPDPPESSTWTGGGV